MGGFLSKTNVPAQVEKYVNFVLKIYHKNTKIRQNGSFFVGKSIVIGRKSHPSQKPEFPGYRAQNGRRTALDLSTLSSLSTLLKSHLSCLNTLLFFIVVGDEEQIYK